MVFISHAYEWQKIYFDCGSIEVGPCSEGGGYQFSRPGSMVRTTTQAKVVAIGHLPSSKCYYSECGEWSRQKGSDDVKRT